VPSGTSKAILVLSGIVLLGAGIVAWERQTWLQDMSKQCASAQPLVQRRASREQVLQAIGRPSSEHSVSDLPPLLRRFDSTPPKRENLEQNLRGSNTLLLYSESNSMMFVYLDGQAQAIQAACFLQ
jgi:hypothetical protein